jgi:pimeloyl-ACP methyl ester carboxylesterase
VDLPGFGATPPLSGRPSIAALADALEHFLDEHDLDGGRRRRQLDGRALALELARAAGSARRWPSIPGGFWTSREQKAFGASVKLSILLVRALRPVLPALVGNPVTRTLLLAQFSAAPWRLDGGVALRELQRYAAAPSFDAALDELARGPRQEGMPAGTARGPIVLGWGRRDLVTLPRQAPRAARLFPDAEVVWFDGSGHFPHWDRPDEAVRTILAATSGR